MSDATLPAQKPSLPQGGRRRIQQRVAVVSPVPIRDVAALESDVQTWLARQAKRYALPWLLAHADDGVIWGARDGDQLVTSCEAARHDAEAQACCPPLRAVTLQQARLFGPSGELLLWPAESPSGGRTWSARLIREAASLPGAAAGGSSKRGQPLWWEESFDETYLLWGTHGRLLAHGFTLLADGAQGLRHAVPWQVPLGQDGALREAPLRALQVRHYLARGAQARVAASRLVDLVGAGREQRP